MHNKDVDLLRWLTTQLYNSVERGVEDNLSDISFVIDELRRAATRIEERLA